MKKAFSHFDNLSSRTKLLVTAGAIVLLTVGVVIAQVTNISGLANSQTASAPTDLLMIEDASSGVPKKMQAQYLGVRETITSGTADDFAINPSLTLNDSSAAGGSDKAAVIKTSLTETDATSWDDTYQIYSLLDGSPAFYVDSDGDIYGRRIGNIDDTVARMEWNLTGGSASLRWRLNNVIRMELEFNDDLNFSQNLDLLWKDNVNASSGSTQVGITSPGDGMLELVGGTSGGSWPDVQVTNSNDATGYITRTTARQVVSLSGATTDTTINLASGVRLLGASFNVDTAVVDDAGDDTWSAEFHDGASMDSLASSAASAQNTKVDTLIADVITDATTNIRFTPNGGSFTSGSIEVVVYYESLVSLGNAP